MLLRASLTKLIVQKCYMWFSFCEATSLGPGFCPWIPMETSVSQTPVLDPQLAKSAVYIVHS